ncbi:MAG: aminodeoxychorismate synthase, component I [Burkholderiales bacterium 28-67-8]|nr:MAG: aminodeoxychorismate synthase, component I [Burkholderiales bacterium 28-67-8]
MPSAFALLDDHGATAERPSSRLYSGFVREHRCVDAASLDAIWARADADLRAGLHALVLADYEWGATLQGIASPHPPSGGDAPALRVLMFGELQRLTRAEVDAWLDAQDADHAAAGVMHQQADTDLSAFTDAIERIHEAIRAGETYQVNHTYRLHAQAYGSPVALYRRLRARQPVAFGAFIELPAAPGDQPRHILSCSPELFLRHEAGELTTRPMKGTAARADSPAADLDAAQRLALDPKARAENLMIVDLLRNDLGRIALTGSVRVSDLFAVEPYASMFQMTSTVHARVRPDVGFGDVLRAVFPCGSITGAPKHHTMTLIAQLERSPRGLYCGAIGWVEPPQGDARLGRFCLSVAIRTLTLGAPHGGLRAAQLGVGAGIVLDSRATDEFEECALKARFLTGLDPGFELFETMRASAGGVAQLDRHLARLAHSAQTLGFAFDRAAALALIEDFVSRLPTSDAGGANGLGGAAGAISAFATSTSGSGPHRLRLSLAHDGRLTLTHGALTPLGVAAVTSPSELAAASDTVGLLIATQRLSDANPLAEHKTTLRRHYDDGVRAAEQAGAFDSLFFTEDGRLVEGGRTSVFVKLDGRWFTPPVTDGALPGVMRATLLEDPAWQATERTLRLEDLARAEALVVCNALRGALPAHLSTPNVRK